VWCERYGAETGGIGVLGVAGGWRERGIGRALAATVTELLRVRGLGRSFVGWTWLTPWYGELGYRACQEHVMSWRTL
jgi:predicted N-acetyltransferase YhbS